jgi:hypothetical protein
MGLEGARTEDDEQFAALVLERAARSLDAGVPRDRAM